MSYTSTRLETTSHVRTGGGHYRETKQKDSKVYHITKEDCACVSALYCGPVRGTAGKIARVALWTGTGALIGAPFGGVGAGVGAGIGFVIGVGTLLKD